MCPILGLDAEKKWKLSLKQALKPDLPAILTNKETIYALGEFN